MCMPIYDDGDHGHGGGDGYDGDHGHGGGDGYGGNDGHDDYDSNGGNDGYGGGDGDGHHGSDEYYERPHVNPHAKNVNYFNFFGPIYGDIHGLDDDDENVSGL